MNPNQPSIARAWGVTFAGTGINLALGVIYGWSVFAVALIDQMGWTKTQSQYPYTLACVFFAIFMIIGGRYVDKVGPRWVATAGAVLVGLGMMICSINPTVIVVTIGFGVIVGASMGLGYSAPTPAAVKWFQPHKKGQIAGLVVAGFGLAAVYIAPLTNFLIQNYGISRAFFIEGILFFVIILVLSQVLAFPPKNYVPYGGPPPAVKNAANAISGRDYTPTEMLKTSQFFKIWLMFCFGASAGLLVIGHLATISQIQGGIHWGFILVAVLAVANAGGRVVAGWISDKLGRTHTMLLVFVIQAVNMAMFITYTTGVTLLIGSIITGLAYGALLSLFPSITFDYFGLKNAATNYGLVFSSWGAAALIGPIIAGVAADLTGGYQASYFISAVLLIIAAAISLVTKAPVTSPSIITGETARAGSQL